MTESVRALPIGDVALAYRSAGSGPAVLCIQGVGVAGCGWRPQLEALAQRYRVLTRCCSRTSTPSADVSTAAPRGGPIPSAAPPGR
jgi:hypothetical protein